MKRWNAVLCAVLLPVLLVSASCGTVLSKDRLLEIIPEDINTVNADHFIYAEKRSFTVSPGTLEDLREWLLNLDVERKEKFKDGEYPGQTIDGGESYYFRTPDGMTLFSFQDFGPEERYLVLDGEWYRLRGASSPPVQEHEGSESPAARRPMVMVDGMLYLDTGRESPMGASAAISGEICSSTGVTELPTENGQSNFGFVGNSYVLEDETLYVNMDGKWIIFEQEAQQDKPPMLMVDGILYRSTGRGSAVHDRCGTLDGEITSSVDGAKLPAENGQSNFGTGFGYQFGSNDTIEVYMPEGEDRFRWIIFEPYSK